MTLCIGLCFCGYFLTQRGVSSNTESIESAALDLGVATRCLVLRLAIKNYFLTITTNLTYDFAQAVVVGMCFGLLHFLRLNLTLL